MLGLLIQYDLALTYLCDLPPFTFPRLTQVFAGPHTYQVFNSPKVYVLAVPCAFLTHALDIYRDHSHII